MMTNLMYVVGVISIRREEKEKKRYLFGIFKKEEGENDFIGKLVMGNKYSRIIGEGSSIEMTFRLINDKGPYDYYYRLNPIEQNIWTGTWESTDSKGSADFTIIQNLPDNPQIRKIWETLEIGKPASKFHR